MRKILLALILCLLLPGCNLLDSSQVDASTQSNEAPALATPYAQQPAAGICGQAEGQMVEINLEPGIPNPRCVQVRPDQTLVVINNTGQFVAIGLGSERTGLGPGQSYTFVKQFGELLQEGVHLLYVDPCCGGEIILSGQ
jgi:hypothetical protein